MPPPPFFFSPPFDKIHRYGLYYKYYSNKFGLSEKQINDFTRMQTKHINIEYKCLKFGFDFFSFWSSFYSSPMKYVPIWIIFRNTEHLQWVRGLAQSKNCLNFHQYCFAESSRQSFLSLSVSLSSPAHCIWFRFISTRFI